MPGLAVLGHPVSHSRSPAMQNAALESLGLSGEWAYEAIDVAPEDFAARVAEMAAGDYAGANVTVPHKEAALGVAGTAGRAAREIGAANTLSFSDGDIHAENTDAPGFLAALPSAAGGERALVLGAGGAARAVVWALVGEGAEVTVWNRTAGRAAALTSELGGTVAEDDPGRDYALIVNTTTAGMAGGPSLAELPVDPAAFGAGQTVVDLVYGDGETELVSAAREAGADVVDGLEMLVRQGAESLRIWTGADPPIEVMRAAARG